MNFILSKSIIFLGLSLISFVPVALVAYASNYDLSFASDISISFAYVGVCFSIGYLGQRSFLAINASPNEGLSVHAIFRFLNLFGVILFLLFIALAVQLPLYILCVAVAIKLSEAVIDLNAGYKTKTIGVDASGKEFFLYAALRALFLCCLFFMVPVVTVENFIIHTFFSVLLFLFIFTRLIPISFFWRGLRAYDFDVYKRQFKGLLGFGVASISCAILTSSPRLFLVGDSNVEVVAIALSAAPVCGLIFQTIWLSNIRRLSSRRSSDYFVFFVEVLLVLLVVYFTAPLWMWSIPFIYGDAVGGGADVFLSVILSSVIFFGAMALVNLFKFEAPFLEFFVHCASFGVYAISYVYFECSVAEGLMLSSGSMFLSVGLLFITKIILDCKAAA